MRFARARRASRALYVSTSSSGIEWVPFVGPRATRMWGVIGITISSASSMVTLGNQASHARSCKPRTRQGLIYYRLRMGKTFPSDFYVTCATVIPVFFLALIVQDGMYESMLKTARQAAQTPPRRQRDIAAVDLLPAAAWLTIVAGVVGEGISLFALYNGSERSGQRPIVLVFTLIPLFAVAARPARRYLQTSEMIRRDRKAGKARRDRDFKRINSALQNAVHKEPGERHDDFLVRGGRLGTPFLVICRHNDEAMAAREIDIYTQTLRSDGFEVEAYKNSSRILQVSAKRSD